MNNVTSSDPDMIRRKIVKIINNTQIYITL